MAVVDSRSLKTRVALAMGLVLVIGGMIAVVSTVAYGRQAAKETYDQLLIGAVSAISDAVSIRDGAPVVDLPIAAFEILALAPDDRITYRIVGPDGATLTGFADVVAPKDSSDLVVYDGRFAGEDARFVAQTRRFAERGFSGSVQVIVGQTLRARSNLAANIVQNALMALGLAGGVMALVGWLAVQSALRPLPRIRDALLQRDPTDLTPITQSAPHEIATVLRALNGFMARLDRQASVNRNLIGDAAHQLRTPVAALRAQIQLAMDEPDGVERQSILSRVNDRIISLSRFLDQVLSRAMIIHRTDTAPRAIVDLRDIALDLTDDDDIRIVAGDTRIRVDIPDTALPVRADALSLSEAGKNLVINALRHGVPPISIQVSSSGSNAQLSVTDAGSGPDSDTIEKLGERYTQGRAGGLGLAIARAVAVAHEGDMLMQSNDQGFQVTITLPVAEAKG